ncbi:hypothetical protein L2E82_08109 [Cichorium intybus]|uniref:Uncharacterized protein n=1 Tax=Cichorium intybus TaxID=13427 RepID=A0ACB9G6K1_CICIN|nr:hypothetical protein L2E82_08109 [Cichorium intybus]
MSTAPLFNYSCSLHRQVPEDVLRKVFELLLVSSSLHRTLVSSASLWLVLDFHEMNNAGERLIAALALFAGSLQHLEHLNLNVCQKISDKGNEAITAACSSLKIFSIYWNGVSDKSLQMVADNYRYLDSLDITRCIKITDMGLQQIMTKCSGLKSLNLYELSSFTDEAYKKLSLLGNLRFLDLCGAQNLSDDGLFSIAKCKDLRTLSLTWCVRVTDMGVIAIAKGCTSLEYLSLFGIVGVTDKCLEVLSEFCSNTITTLDVNGCIGIKILSLRAQVENLQQSQAEMVDNFQQQQQQMEQQQQQMEQQMEQRIEQQIEQRIEQQIEQRLKRSQDEFQKKMEDMMRQMSQRGPGPS